MKHLKFLTLPLLIAFFAVGYFFADKAFAYGNGVYTNIFGSGYVSCTENCDSLYIGQADCSPDTGTCTGKDTNGGNEWWTYRFVCDGKHNECGGNGPAPLNVSKVKGNAQKVDLPSIACGQTVQLDVFDKECDADPNNWACGGDSLKGYMVWYSGDCAPPPVACNTSCANDPTICQQATDGCTACNPTSKTCQPPTTTPACNTSCANDPTICQQATDGCTTCNPTTQRCEAAPTEPPTGPPTEPPTGEPTQPPPGPACNTSCDNNPTICQQATDGCTRCDLTTKRCVPPPGVTVTPTSVPSVPTPTTPPPDNGQGACKCDGMTVSALVAGQNATFTANAKVEGSNVGQSSVKSMSFFFGESAKGSTKGSAIGSSGPLPATLNQSLSSPNKSVYTSQWTYKLPTNVAGKSYRAWAQIECNKNSANAGNANTAVLAAEDENTQPSFFGQIENFFKGLFGQETETTTPDATIQEDASIEQINLGTVQPGNVTLKACSMLFFEFPEMK